MRDLLFRPVARQLQEVPLICIVPRESCRPVFMPRGTRSAALGPVLRGTDGKGIALGHLHVPEAAPCRKPAAAADVLPPVTSRDVPEAGLDPDGHGRVF